MCVRSLNKANIKDKFPILNVDELLGEHDLKSWYH